MKPDDVQQDIWHRAEIAVLGKIYGNRISGPQSFRVELVACEIMHERNRSIAVVEALMESLNEGLMTDTGLTIEDTIAMKHQITALETAAAEIRKLGNPS